MNYAKSTTLALVLALVLTTPASAGLAGLEPLRAMAPNLDPEVLRLALNARSYAEQKGLLERPEILTVIDYSLPSTEQRLWIFDLAKPVLLYRELVAHGMGTGENFAETFSNRSGSKQSSLGLFTTAGTYYGRNGYSLYLHGQEPGVNDLAFERTIVMHGAWYVSESFVREHGRLGRSWGCPALSTEVSDEIIDLIKDGTALFAYSPDEVWLASSEFLSSPHGIEAVGSHGVTALASQPQPPRSRTASSPANTVTGAPSS
jgi:hypothetical protein